PAFAAPADWIADGRRSPLGLAQLLALLGDQRLQHLGRLLLHEPWRIVLEAFAHLLRGLGKVQALLGGLRRGEPRVVEVVGKQVMDPATALGAIAARPLIADLGAGPPVAMAVLQRGLLLEVTIEELMRLLALASPPSHLP